MKQHPPKGSSNTHQCDDHLQALPRSCTATPAGTAGGHAVGHEGLLQVFLRGRKVYDWPSLFMLLFWARMETIDPVAHPQLSK